jgi:effector-binding domain-containing protein
MVLALVAVLIQAGCAYERGYPRTQEEEFEVKELPPMRALIAREEGRYFDHSNRLFRRLFDYIKKNEIPMTVPVEMRSEPATMIFLVDSANADRELEAGQGVEVERLPARLVASHGARGSYSRENFEAAASRLSRWVQKKSQYRTAGESYAVYWQGPFVPSFLKHFEVHIPVEKARTENGDDPQWRVLVPDDGGSLGLEDYRWENRLLLVFESGETPERREFETRLEQHAEGVVDRDLLMIPVGGEGGAWDNAAQISRRFNAADADFLVLLVGKDGTEKKRWTSVPSIEEIFEIIDAMPMRQREMQRKEREATQ